MSRRKRRNPHWTPAGTLCIDPNAPKPEVDVIAYGDESFEEEHLEDLKWVEKHKGKHQVLWINVDGLGDSFVVTELGRIFNLHKLALEDVVNGNQRPKVDVYEGHLFVSLRMLYRHEGRVETEQLSMFIGKDFLISFQEGIPGDCFDPVRERLRKEASKLRCGRTDFLAYNLIDAVVDAYFPYLEDLGEQLEALEDRLMSDPSREIIQEIHTIKRDLLIVRRAVWPLREMINPLMREETPLISHDTRIFLRDCYDHCIQVVDLLETYREVASSLMDIYLSSISNKMNEVMKVLTIITTIFVPLTFVAGVYGMNFNTEKSPWNMPELNAYYGYPLCWLVMFLIAGAEIFYFWRRGWIWERKSPPPPARPTASLPGPKKA
jgi:magnesium transporter